MAGELECTEEGGRGVRRGQFYGGKGGGGAGPSVRWVLDGGGGSANLLYNTSTFFQVTLFTLQMTLFAILCVTFG